MALNPTKLKPAKLVRLLNSAGFGEVISDSMLRRHRNRAGYTIGDEVTVDLLRYTAWLTGQYLRPSQDARSYDEVKEAARKRISEMVRAGQDIGQIPAVVSADRKAQALASFKTFCEVYFPDVFYLPWSDDHHKVIEKIEQAVLKGGLFGLAMPRGSGKALALETPLATPQGWTTMGKVQVGDQLFDEQGHMCRVIHTTEVMHHHQPVTAFGSAMERRLCAMPTIFGRSTTGTAEKIH